MRPLLKGTSQILGAGLTAYALAALYSVVTARYLGPTGKGTVTLLLLLPAFGVSLLSGGLEIANTYFVGRSRDELAPALANSLCYAALVGAAGLVGLLALRAPLNRAFFELSLPLTGFVLAGVLLPLSLLRDLLYSLLLGLRDFAAVAVCRTTRELAMILCTCLVLVLWQATPRAVLVAAFAATVLTILVSALLLRRHLRGWSLRPDAQLLRRYLTLGIKGHVGTIAQRVNYRLDRLLLAFFVGQAAVGYYSVAVGLAELLLLAPGAVAEVLFPTIAHERARRSGVLTPLALKYTALLVVGGGLVLAGSAGWLIPLLFGAQFAPALRPMLWLLPGVVAVSLGKVLIGDLSGRGLPQYATLGAGVALLFTVALDMTLIPRWGVNGAALASSASYLAGTLVMGACFVRVLRGPRRQISSASPGPAVRAVGHSAPPGGAA